MENGNIRMDLREIGCEGVNWIQMAQYRVQRRDLVNSLIDIRTV